jgi:four helix bundle protein
MVRDIDKRTFSFGVRIVELVGTLPRSTAGIAIANQIIRSGTSIGANVQEAIGAHTKQEFAYKMNIAKSEARETQYWLRMLSAMKLINSNIDFC